MDNLVFEKKIEQATKKWMPAITRFLKQLYKDKWLPSHDINHHRRVWHNAVDLSRLTINKSQQIRSTFAEELIICCFFHDTGLLINPGEFHGKESKELAMQFLALNSRKVNFDTKELLESIEKHDDKNYLMDSPNSNYLLEILTLADDIDAFGAIGLYRYIEIYLLRGLDNEKIPELILSNAEIRYNNLQNCLKRHNFVMDIYYLKYKDLVKLLSVKNYCENPVILVKWIKLEIVDLKLNPYKRIMESDTEVLKNERLAGFALKFKEEYLQNR